MGFKMKGFSPFNKGAKYTSAYKKASYADAKKNDPDLDAKIKAVRSGDLNRNEQAKMQNKINEAYGVDKRHETNDPIKGPKKIMGSDTKKEPSISKNLMATDKSMPKPAPEKTKYEKKADKIIERGKKKEEKKENRQKNREERKDKRDKNQKRRQDLRNTKKKINKEAKDSKKMAKFLSKNPYALDAAKNV